MSNPPTKPPLSPTRRAGPLLFVSGQLPRQADGSTARGTIEEQTEIVIDNLEAALSSHGLSLADVVKTTAWLTDERLISGFNNVYGARFGMPYPTRSTVISALVAAADVEIEAIAFFPE